MFFLESSLNSTFYLRAVNVSLRYFTIAALLDLAYFERTKLTGSVSRNLQLLNYVLINPDSSIVKTYVV